MWFVRLHPDAEEEAVSAAEWYEIQQTGLGRDFLAELDRTVALLSESPTLWPYWPGVKESFQVRRALLSRFPYAVAYTVLENKIIIYAVAHLSRRPGYWKDRPDAR